MNTSQSTYATRLKVGVFTFMTFFVVGVITFFVNNKPFWWKQCQPVLINVEDATGLKMKSPVRSLGIEIGYLKSILLSESHVTLGICITAPVEVLTSTRAYLRGEGFLGDKFVELKPVKYVGPMPAVDQQSDAADDSEKSSQSKLEAPLIQSFLRVSDFFISSAWGSEDENKDKTTDTEKAKTSDSEKATVSVKEKDREPASPSGDPLNQGPADGSPKVSSKEDGPINTGDSTQVPKSNNFDDEAEAIDPPVTKKRLKRGGTEIPVGDESSQDMGRLVNRVNGLVTEMSGIAKNLNNALDPADLKRTMMHLNRAVENASKTLAPEGGLNQTAVRILAKLEDSMEQLRDLLTRINKGEGSAGMLINDPRFAEDVRLALKNVNRLLNKFSDFRFVVDLGGSMLTGYNGGRGLFQIGIWPKPDRYYLIGIAMDPRGQLSNMTTTTTVGGFSQTTQTLTTNQTGILLTAMLGKVFYGRFDLAVGALYGDGAVSVNFLLGPRGDERRIELKSDTYFRSAGSSIDERITLTVQPIPNIYLRAGLESVYAYTGTNIPVLSYGAGLKFDDEDIKLLFALR